MNLKLLTVSALSLGVLYSCSTTDTDNVMRAIDGAGRAYYGGGTQPTQPYVAPAPVAPVYPTYPVANPYQRLY